MWDTPYNIIECLSQFLQTISFVGHDRSEATPDLVRRVILVAVRGLFKKKRFDSLNILMDFLLLVLYILVFRRRRQLIILISLNFAICPCARRLRPPRNLLFNNRSFHSLLGDPSSFTPEFRFGLGHSPDNQCFDKSLIDNLISLIAVCRSSSELRAYEQITLVMSGSNRTLSKSASTTYAGCPTRT
jgi:hypothetical protein